jgi:hypothetical protein
MSPTSAGANRSFPTNPDGSRRGSFSKDGALAAGPAAAAGGLVSRGGSAGLKCPGIERDESARSDVSVFSIASVDMGEFLSEFRVAHFSLFGPDCPLITIDQLGDVVDRVALPLPDTRILADLFAEMDIEHSGLVSFEAFLARMNFRIQGRYHADVIRGLFFALLQDSGIEVPAVGLDFGLQ